MMKIKKFNLEQEKEINDFLASVDLIGNGLSVFDGYVIITYKEKTATFGDEEKLRILRKDLFDVDRKIFKLGLDTEYANEEEIKPIEEAIEKLKLEKTILMTHYGTINKTDA